jgi:cell wall integrity and stress response component
VATTGSFSAIRCSAGRSIAFSYYTLGTVATVTTTGTTTVSASDTTTVSASGTSRATAQTITSTGVSLYDFSSVTLFAPMFQLVHQASDLPSSGSSGTSGGATKSTATESTSPAHTTGSSLGTATNGLSSGAIAGVAVGSIVVGLALIGAFIYLCLKQRRQKKIIAQYAPPPFMGGSVPQHAMHAGSYFTGSTPLSMKSIVTQQSPVYEAPADTPRHELA